MDKRTAAPLSGRAAPQGVDGSDETDKGTCPEKRVPEADGTGQAVQEVGGCDYPSLLPVVSLVPVPNTGKNGGNGQVGTDGGIERYLFHGEERFPAYGYQTEEAVPVHRMLAMYTFMQDVYSKENPESKQERPSPQEVRSSVRILDFHRKESDMWELCNLAVHLMPPSRYVALRYGLADDYDRLDRLNRSGPESAYDEGVILESRLCRNAEKAAESIKDVRLPDFYLERLDGELEILGRIAASPDVVHDILQISPDFLAKYGIDKNVSATERSCQAEKAYRELDARFVRMTGRRPYADELFASIRRKRENSGIENRPRQAQRTILRNPPSKGRKMGI